MIRALLLAPAIMLALCVPCFAQLKLSEARIQVYEGFQNPRIVDGKLIADGDSKPVLASSSAIIKVEKEVEFKWFFVEAERLPTFDTVELLEVEGGYVFPADTPPGKYRVTAQGFDPVMARKRIDVIVEGPGPTPAPVPIDDSLSAVGKLSREALQAYAQAMASNFEQIATEAEQGRLKTIQAAEEAYKPRDLDARNAFKRKMAEAMAPALGNGPELPANAPKVFREIATGFKGAR